MTKYADLVLMAMGFCVAIALLMAGRRYLRPRIKADRRLGAGARILVYASIFLLAFSGKLKWSAAEDIVKMDKVFRAAAESVQADEAWKAVGKLHEELLAKKGDPAALAAAKKEIEAKLPALVAGLKAKDDAVSPLVAGTVEKLFADVLTPAADAKPAELAKAGWKDLTALSDVMGQVIAAKKCNLAMYDVLCASADNQLAKMAGLKTTNARLEALGIDREAYKNGLADLSDKLTIVRRILAGQPANVDNISTYFPRIMSMYCAGFTPTYQAKPVIQGPRVGDFVLIDGVCNATPEEQGKMRELRNARKHGEADAMWREIAARRGVYIKKADMEGWHDPRGFRQDGFRGDPLPVFGLNKVGLHVNDLIETKAGGKVQVKLRIEGKEEATVEIPPDSVIMIRELTKELKDAVNK